MKKTFAALSMALLLGAALAAPVAEDQRVGIDFRRTTLVVRNIESSLALYRDALGMQVIYDNIIRRPHSAQSDEDAERVSRLVFLRANDDFVGIVGLLQYMKPQKSAAHQGAEPFTPGSSVLLFNTTDLNQSFTAARAVTGVRVLSEPRLTEYPSYDGKGSIAVKVSVITDPDGFVIELNQLQEGLKRP